MKLLTDPTLHLKYSSIPHKNRIICVTYSTDLTLCLTMSYYLCVQVNLIMDTLGALALGTECPTATVLDRKPYKRSASLISRPMWRNILCQSAFQLILLFVLLFKGAEMFGVRPLSETNCFTYYVENGSQRWDSATLLKSSTGDISCSSFQDFCPEKDDSCYQNAHRSSATGDVFRFNQLPDFATSCLTCYKSDHVHGSIIFNAFIFCQVQNFIAISRLLPFVTVWITS